METLLDWLPKFTSALREQLIEDQLRWGDTWLRRPRLGQEERIFARFDEYIHDYRVEGKPIPWMKVAGLALIAWVREHKGVE